MSVVSAFADGCRRALRAPALIVGVWLAFAFVPTPVLVERIDVYLALIDAAAMDPISPMLGLVWNTRSLMHAALATFLLGGLLDRLARDRATASFGFFGACGVFFFRFLRLAFIATPIYAFVFLVVFPALPDGVVPSTFWLALIVLALHALFDYAKVRMVVEDRRSAVGALAAAARFVTRHAGMVFPLLLVNGLLAGGVWWLASAFGIGTTAALYAYLLARVLLRLISMASNVSLFQSRLAHAGYVARPVATWPESPAAEAVLPR